MSLILDALNRSQRDSAAPQAVPGLASSHYADRSGQGGGWRQALLVAALLVALAVIAWLLWGPAEPDGDESAGAPLASSQASSAGADTSADPTVPPAIEPAPPPGIAALVPPTGQRSEASPVKPVAEAEVAALYAASAAGTRAEPEREQQKAAAASPRGSQASAQAATAGEQPVDVAQLLSVARAEMGSSGLTAHPAPMLAELSQQRKDAIPTLLYSAHDFRGERGQASQVLINGRQAGTGDEVARGVVVTEILADSVVLRFDGEAFRLKALNSWVNL